VSGNATATTHDGPTTGRGGGSYERITVNLTEKASYALADSVQISRDSKTDCINKALQLYGLLQRIQEAGGAVYLREKDGAELERLRVL
jgi:hypothetical protein